MRWQSNGLAAGVLIGLLACSLAVSPAEEGKSGGSMPMFGATPSRNLVNTTDKGIPDSFAVRPKGKEKNLKWTAALGTMAYGGPVIAGGRIFIGTNNDKPRDPKVKGDKGVLMCFRESDGEFLWQIVHDKLPEENDAPKQGIISVPCVDGNHVYYVSNRAEFVCADVATGKIVWLYDMVKELEVFVGQAVYTSPLVLGDLVYALTSNGVEVGSGKLPSPKAPSLVALNKKTGKLVWSNGLPGANVIRGQWSNPAAATVNGRTQVIYGGGDGYLYGLDAATGELIWKFDCNPKKVTPYKPGGGGQRSFIVATPVIYENRCYVGVGQEPDDGPGVGHLWCIDFTKQPKNAAKDLSPVGDNFDPKAEVNKDSGLVWHYGGPVVPKPKDDARDLIFGRTLSTVCIHDGLVYAAELAGYLHCLDAKTGAKQWEHDFQEGTWCSSYYVDGKVFVGTDSGDLYIFKAGNTLANPKKISFGVPIKVPPVACNGVLYVNNGANLFAIAPGK